MMKKTKVIEKGFQQSLDKWFVRTDGEGNLVESTFTIFYLDWSTLTANWISIMPENEKITYRCVVKWGNHNIHVVGYIPLNTSTVFNSTDSSQSSNQIDNKKYIDGESYYTNVSFLKSHLQKAVRRSQTSTAIKTAHHFYRLDTSEFLRRVTIIMLEDVHLMSSFNILLWLMVAHSKGYSLTKSQTYWLYGLVYNLATAKYWDKVSNISDTISVVPNVPEKEKEKEKEKETKETKEKGIKEIKEKEKEKEETKETKEKEIKEKEKETKEIREDDWKRHLPKLNTLQKSLVYSLQFRKAFGGLTGDKKLIQNLTNIWIKRFLNTKQTSIEGNKKEKNTETIETKPYSDQFWCDILNTSVRFLSPPEEPLTLDQWILPAIDFHCAPNIISILSDKYAEFSQEDMKMTIWHCSSKYNNKLRTNDAETTDYKKYAKIWEVIRPQFYSLANYFLLHNY